MKVHIADGVSSGEHFVHPLSEIREVLERCIVVFFTCIVTDQHNAYFAQKESLLICKGTDLCACAYMSHGPVPL